MDTKDFNDLRPDPMNPQIMSKDEHQKLVESLKYYGDLSGVVDNIRTGQLVGGHKRLGLGSNESVSLNQVPGQKRIVITEKYEQPDHQGTVAVGYILVGDIRLSYRQVDWPLEKQHAGNMAANNISGHEDELMAAQLLYQISQSDEADELMGLTGHGDKEIEKLINSVAGDDPESPPGDNQADDTDNFKLKATETQMAVIHATIQRLKQNNPQVTELASSPEVVDATALVLLCQNYLDTHPAPASATYEPSTDGAIT